MKHLKRICLVLVLCLVFQNVALASGGEWHEFTNPNLMNWSDAFNEYLGYLEEDMQNNDDMEGGLMSSAFLISYQDNDIVVSDSGIRMVHGGKSQDGVDYSMGMGTSLDDPNLFYVSFTFYNECNMNLSAMIRLSAILAAANCGLDLGDTNDEMVENAKYLCTRLLSDIDGIALSYKDFVIASKKLDTGYLFVIDTQAYYDAFYKGSIENYVDLNE